MRKSGLLFSLLLIICSLYGQPPSPTHKITQSYFRTSPFNKEFSTFLSSLLNDPTISNKVVEKRTDTSLFFFQGTYNSHNPFFFKPTRVDVMLSQIPVPLDSVTRDTVFVYQLLAFDKATKDGERELKKEFEKIYKKYKNNFDTISIIQNKPEETLPGITYYFFDKVHMLAPFGLSWCGPDSKDEFCLVLTIRMSVKNNVATLPIPFYTL